MTKTPTVEAFDHIHVFVADRQAAESWYEKVLGFRRIKGIRVLGCGWGSTHHSEREWHRAHRSV